MTNLKITFSIDPTGFAKDITEEINIPNGVCLYCLHDKDNRLHNEVKKALEYKGYDLRYFFQLIKVYVPLLPEHNVSIADVANFKNKCLTINKKLI